jgi:hypothetical protein
LKTSSISQISETSIEIIPRELLLEVEGVKLAKNDVGCTSLRLERHSRKPGNVYELLEGGVCDIAAAEVNVDGVYAVCVNDAELLVSWPCKWAGLTVRVPQLHSKTELSECGFVKVASRPNLWALHRR